MLMMYVNSLEILTSMVRYRPVLILGSPRGVHPPKSMMHTVFPLFPQNLYISPRFPQNLRFFGSPYFDHDAFMHDALHVLDASAFLHLHNLYLDLSILTFNRN